MSSWSDFRAASPALADRGRELIFRSGTGEVLLATVRADELPRLHPIWVSIVDGALYAFIGSSAKRRDLELDGRFALHSHVDPVKPDEFSIRGRANKVDGERRDRIARSWPFEPDDSYELFELSVENAVLGEREDADAWPPRYTSWKAQG